jgi:hypothetical protein
MDCLSVFHSNSGYIFDSFLEKTFCWDLSNSYKDLKSGVPYQSPWIGVLHNPPNVPSWFDLYNSPQALIEKEIFKTSLKNCVAIVTLSDYLKNWLKERVDVPIVSVKHPTRIPHVKWSASRFFSSRPRKILQIGSWLRNAESFFDLKNTDKYRKLWMPGDPDYAKNMLTIQQKNNPKYYENKYRWSSVEKLDYLKPEEYDDIITESIVFLDLFDSSANNAVIEPIASNTPLLINRIPPLVEYLGDDYPLFYDSTEHAGQILKNDNLIYDAHVYLKNMEKNWISGSYFANSLVDKLTKVVRCQT